jgi:hypothetical protein
VLKYIFLTDLEGNGIVNSAKKRFLGDSNGACANQTNFKTANPEGLMGTRRHEGIFKLLKFL